MSGRHGSRGQVTGALAADESVPRRAVLGWAFYDWGSAAFNAVIVTFVFSVYLTDSVGAEVSNPPASTWLSLAIAAGGVVIALTAPVMGQRADRAGRRKRAVGVWTALTIMTMLAMFFVEDDSAYLWLGLVLLAAGSVTFEFAEVSYFAMLKQVSNRDNIGKVSGFGWGMGYFGGIFLLLACYLGFIVDTGEEATRGLLALPVEDGLNIRMVCVFAAVWFALFALPLFFTVPEIPPDEGAEVEKSGAGFIESYRVLVRDVVALWRTDRRTVGFLVAAAIYRDGLAGVFTFGAILAVTVYEIDPGDVLIFGVAANLVAAIGSFVAGYLDDGRGPKTVIVVSLMSMVVTAGILLFVEGPTNFWIFGLLLCAFVGPAQSASRTFLSRLTPAGRDGQFFGLYATTGRAVSFLAPAMFALFTGLTGEDRWGIVGIALILGLGLALLLPVRPPERSG